MPNNRISWFFLETSSSWSSALKMRGEKGVPIGEQNVKKLKAAALYKAKMIDGD